MYVITTTEIYVGALSDQHCSPQVSHPANAGRSGHIANNDVAMPSHALPPITSAPRFKPHLSVLGSGLSLPCTRPRTFTLLFLALKLTKALPRLIGTHLRYSQNPTITLKLIETIHPGRVALGAIGEGPRAASYATGWLDEDFSLARN